MNEKSPDASAAIIHTSQADGTSANAESTLSPLRERFCRYYLTEPSAARAAVKAGYSERTAGQEAHRLLKNVEILQRIDAIRRAEHLVYEPSPQAVMDRCEAIFEEALEKGRFEGAIGALRLQAKVGGLLKPDAPGATKPDLTGMIEYCVRTAVSNYIAFGTVGSMNPLTPPPWAPGEEEARRQRRAMARELEEAKKAARAEDHARAMAGWPKREGTLIWPGDDASLLGAAAGHDDAFRRAEGLESLAPGVRQGAPPEDVEAAAKPDYGLGRTAEPGAPGTATKISARRG